MTTAQNSQLQTTIETSINNNILIVIFIIAVVLLIVVCIIVVIVKRKKAEPEVEEKERAADRQKQYQINESDEKEESYFEDKSVTIDEEARSSQKEISHVPEDISEPINEKQTKKEEPPPLGQGIFNTPGEVTDDKLRQSSSNKVNQNVYAQLESNESDINIQSNIDSNNN